MARLKHTYKKDDLVYEMVLIKDESLESFLLLPNGQKVKTVHGRSAVTPSKTTYFLLTDCDKVDITKTIDKLLKDEIVNDFFKMNFHNNKIKSLIF